MALLSVLDLSPVTTGTLPSAALGRSVDLARSLDGLGYHRYWLAEHHNLPSIASSAPEVMICRIAAATDNIRVGSGGIMLPNHAPLMVAERFKLLEGLFPGRIDLGIGRAPGTDQITSIALRRRQDIRADDDFLERFQELLLIETSGFPEGHPFGSIRAMPDDAALPPIFLLGSSDYSAALAARIGVGFSFAHHFAGYDVAAAMQAYRRGFQPTAALARPHAILALAAVCAETAEEAEKLASTVDLNFVRRARGIYMPLASPEEAAAEPYSEIDRERIRQNRARLFVGTPETVKTGIERLAALTAAEEIMITTMIHDHDARKRSYALLAEAFGLQAPSPRSATETRESDRWRPADTASGAVATSR